MAYLSPVQFANSNILGTTLNGTILAGDNTLTITSQAVLGCPTIPSFDLLIDNELITVNGIAGNVCTPLSRGAGGTTPAGHTTGVAVFAPITVGMIAAAFARIDQANASGLAGTYLSASGINANVVSASRIVGAVAPGAGVLWTPVGGPYVAGDIVLDVSNAGYYVNTVGGSPGTFIAAPSRLAASLFNADLTAAARVILTGSPSKIMLGATGGGFRDSADTIDLLKSDAVGLLTARNALSVPPSVGASLPVTAYGTLPVKLAESLLVGTAASISFASIPAGFRSLKLFFYCREDPAVAADLMFIRVNNDAAANYDGDRVTIAGVAVGTPVEQLGVTIPTIALIPGASATANFFGQGEITLAMYAGVTGQKMIQCDAAYSDSNLTAHGAVRSLASVKWRTVATAINRVDLFPGSGNFIAGSYFALWGFP